MAKRKIRYSEGDVFLVPSRDGKFFVGQIIVDGDSDIGALFCYFFDLKVAIDEAQNISDLSSEKIISAILITPEMIQRGYWTIIANCPVVKSVHEKLYWRLKENNFVGSRVNGGGLIADKLDTYYGLLEESYWARLDMVYEAFLVPPEKRQS